MERQDLFRAATNSGTASSFTADSRLGPPQVYPSGVELFRQGRLLDDVFRISSGTVKMPWTGSEGEETILLLAFAGAWLGAAPVIARKPTPVGAVTCEETVVNRVPADLFRSLVRSDPELSAAIHQRHAEELCRQMTWFAQRTALTARQRLEWILRPFIVAARSGASQKSARVLLPLHRWELARLIGISPEHLCRLTKQMQGEGIIRCDRGWIIVPDVERLCRSNQSDDTPWCAPMPAADVRE